MRSLKNYILNKIYIYDLGGRRNTRGGASETPAIQEEIRSFYKAIVHSIDMSSNDKWQYKIAILSL